MSLTGRLLTGAAAGVVLLLMLALALLAGLSGQAPQLKSGGNCRLLSASHATGSSSTGLDAEQLTNARIIVGTAEALDLPQRAAMVGLATALQESALRSLSQAQSDRDSAGIFQQRPSMGWGSLDQVMDPVYAAQVFFERLQQVSGWQDMPVTLAAQAVQRSAYANAYAKWTATAQHLAGAISGRGAAQVTCTPDVRLASSRRASGHWAPEQMGSDELTARTRYVRDLVKSGFGETNLGGWCPSGCTSGHVTGSDHYTGQAIDVMILPYTDPDRIADGNRLADWLVANAGKLGIKYVIWRAQIWAPDEGWHPYDHPSGSSDPTLAHMDHIHVSVY